MTVQNKIFEGLAMAQPVISGNSSALRQALKGNEQIYLCKREDSKSLAKAIINLYNKPDLRVRLAQEGHKVFLKKFSLAQIGSRYQKHLDMLFNQKRKD